MYEKKTIISETVVYNYSSVCETLYMNLDRKFLDEFTKFYVHRVITFFKKKN